MIRILTRAEKLIPLHPNFGLQQLINGPIHLIASSSSCIDLIFRSQSNLVMESGVYLSLHRNRYHRIVLAKFNLKRWYPTSSESEIGIMKIRMLTLFVDKSISSLVETDFFNIDVNQNKRLLNQTIKIFSIILYCMKPLLIEIPHGSIAKQKV